ncbi:MAG: hypothetical protein HY334_03485 [Armatimonadetes bacterium]|nr:hypothetical protein [Armatimonadota bacterium]
MILQRTGAPVFDTLHDMSRRPAFWAAATIVVAFAVYHASFPGPTPFDHYVRLADALLHGRVDLLDPPSYLEVTTFRGRHYMIPPPFPAMLVIPYVAVAGPAADQSLVSHAVGALAAGLLVLLGARLAPRADYPWLGLLAAFGTILWYLSAVGSSWFLSHAVVVAALTLGLLETLGRRRAALIGLAVAMAYWTRLPTILTLAFFLPATAPRWAPGGLRGWRRIDLAYLIWMGAPIAAALLLNGLYNWVRFGTIADIAAAVRPGIFEEAWFSRGLFHLSYIPRHLTILFTKLPVLVDHPPYLLVPLGGLAIWLTTPAFVYALRAPLGRETVAAWSGIAAVAAVDFTFGNPGVLQFGYRFATDFYPLLFLLMVRGMGGRVPPLAKALILVGVAVNAWGVLWTRWGWVAM